MTSPRVRSIVVLALMACAACRKTADTGADANQTVIVFAAASLGESFRALERSYEAAHPNVDVVVNFAGSQLLATQLLEGASADVFAAADRATLEHVLAERPALADGRHVFATNHLMIVVPSESDVDTFDEVDELLASPNTKAVLAAPKVPVGRYAREALERLGLRYAFEEKLVSNEDSVDGVLAKIELGECDVGIAYATDLRRSSKLRGISLPVDVIARYELAVLADGPMPEAGRAFVEFVISPAGQAVLHEHGFGSP